MKSVIMGFSRIFVIYCFPILYFVNLSAPFPINYEKEMAKLRERISGIEDPTQREERLLRIAVEEREDERERADNFKEELGKVKSEKDSIRSHAVRVFVVPYTCQKLELYRDLWDTAPNTPIEDVPVHKTDPGAGDLDEQTFGNYKRNTAKWLRIIKNSNAAGAVVFKQKLAKLYPEESDLMIAKTMGLAQALINNAKHGVIAVEPEMSVMTNPEDLIKGLRTWKSLQDPVLLEHIKIFEIVTTDQNLRKFITVSASSIPQQQ